MIFLFFCFGGIFCIIRSLVNHSMSEFPKFYRFLPHSQKLAAVSLIITSVIQVERRRKGSGWCLEQENVTVNWISTCKNMKLAPYVIPYAKTNPK